MYKNKFVIKNSISVASKYAFKGITQDDFNQIRSEDEIFKIFNQLNYNISKEYFTSLVQQLYSQGKILSVNTFTDLFNANYQPLQQQQQQYRHTSNFTFAAEKFKKPILRD